MCLFSVCLCVGMRVPHMHMETRGKLTVVSSLLSPCGTRGSISGHQAHLQMPVPIEPSHQPFVCLFLRQHRTLSLRQAGTHCPSLPQTCGDPLAAVSQVPELQV